MKLTDKKGRKLSDIDIVVAIEGILNSIGNIEQAVARMEAKVDTFPCEEHTERIVRLEKDRDSIQDDLKEVKGHIEKMYKITREQGEKISGQNIMSEVLKWLVGMILGAGATALIYFVTRG